MYGGDEVNAVVVDVGSHTVKAGFAGEDTPKALFPSVLGLVPNDRANGASPMDTDGATPNKRRRTSNHVYTGTSDVNYRREHMEVEGALHNGLYQDMDIVQELWEHAFKDRLVIDPKEHPILFAEPTFNTKAMREQMVQTIFEQHGCPAIFLAKNAVLSSFATGRQTSLVVDTGHEGAVVCAVHDGYVLQKSISRSPLGGSLLSKCMLKVAESILAEKNFTIRPRYSIKRTERQPGVFEVHEVDSSNTTASFKQYHVDQIAADMKDSICRVSDTPFDEQENANIPTVSYELPDGNEIQIGSDRFKVPEVLFQPKLLSSFKGLETVQGYDGSQAVASIPELVLDSVGKCDVDVRRDLYSGIILTGGTSLFTSLRERLEREVGELAAQNAKVKVTSPANTMERRFSVWLGGSILASLGSFQQMWMSKQEYEEHGAGMIHKKAP